MTDTINSTPTPSTTRRIGPNGVYYETNNAKRKAMLADRHTNEKSYSLKRSDPELFEKLHQDYLTGEHNSATLGEKYGLRPGSVLGHIRFNKWTHELRTSGITPPNEPLATRTVIDQETLRNMESDYANDATLYDLSDKYKIHIGHIIKLAKRHGWLNTKKRYQLQHDVGRPITAAEILRRRVEKIDHVTHRFIDNCFAEFDKLLEYSTSCRADGKPIDIKALKEMIESFEHLYECLRKIKKDLLKGMPVSRREKLKQGTPVLLPIGEDGERVEESLSAMKAPVRMMSEIRKEP